MGIECFDSAVAGMGGCPFAAHKGAAGNFTHGRPRLPLSGDGRRDRVDLDAMIAAGQLAERVVATICPASSNRAANLARYRARAKGATTAGSELR